MSGRSAPFEHIGGSLILSRFILCMSRIVCAVDVSSRRTNLLENFSKKKKKQSYVVNLRDALYLPIERSEDNHGDIFIYGDRRVRRRVEILEEENRKNIFVIVTDLRVHLALDSGIKSCARVLQKLTSVNGWE